MTTQLIDAGKNPTVPVSVTNVSGEIVQNIILTDGTDLVPVGTAGKPIQTTGAVSGTVTANQGTPLGAGTGWRMTEYGTVGLPNVYFNLFGVWEIPVSIIGDPNTGSPWAFISNRGLIQFKSTAVARLVITASITSVTLLPAQTLRSGASIFNNSTAILYIKYGATASLSSWDDKLFPNQKLEVPFGIDTIIDGIWDAAVGDAHVMECY